MIPPKLLSTIIATVTLCFSFDTALTRSRLDKCLTSVAQLDRRLQGLCSGSRLLSVVSVTIGQRPLRLHIL
ncbi:hypothetical protein V1508DRAFT_413098 [Lipomyces doorenjongii]|uniref:uncharacterized protein n=1 Tax=Lipomyces doorenjongii TaxID=383834 RepID=UPI0034CD8C3A